MASSWQSILSVIFTTSGCMKAADSELRNSQPVLLCQKPEAMFNGNIGKLIRQLLHHSCPLRCPSALSSFPEAYENRLSSRSQRLDTILNAGLQGIGDDAESVESSSATITESEQGFMPVYFEPRPLKNLQLVDELESLAPVMDMKASHAPLLCSTTYSQ